MENAKNSPGTSDRELRISRLLNAPRELVWEVFTNPEHIAKWWGPDGFTNTIQTMDVKPGGEWELVMHGPDGTNYKNKSIYKEIDKPGRIVFEHITAPKFLTTITFTPEGTGTRIDWHMLFESKEQFEQVVKVFKADKGLTQNVEKLDHFLSQMPIVVNLLLDAPVTKVWKAITDKNEMKKWYFDLAEFRPEIGFVFEFMGGPEDGVQYTHICEITDLVPEKNLRYSWRYKGYDGSSQVNFELFPQGAQTLVKLTHTGVETFPSGNPDFAKNNFRAGWNQIINGSLKTYFN